MLVVTVALGRQQIVGLIGGRMEMVVSQEAIISSEWRDRRIHSGRIFYHEGALYSWRWLSSTSMVIA